MSWFDFGTNRLHAIRTNKAATRFGRAHVIKAPPATFIFNGLQTDGTSGRLDVIANVLLSTKNNPIEFWHTQILGSLTLTAKPGAFSHRHAAVVTFTVTDAGDRVPGATVSCLGKSGKTSAQGQVKLRFAAGRPAGRHACTARLGDYAPGRTTIRVS